MSCRLQKIIITGATGYIGRALTHHAIALGYRPSVLGRQRPEHAPSPTPFLYIFNDQPIEIPEPIGKDAVIIHLAGRAHILKEDKKEPQLAFTRANVELSLKIADAGIKCDAKRFIFISSIGVNGSNSSTPLDESSAAAPTTLYAKSKWEAEQALSAKLAGQMELTIIRPPLVYAHNAPGNFNKLLRLIHASIPIPLKRTKNHRSLIALENLIDFIMICVEHPLAANETFLVSDSRAVSTEQLASLLRQGMNSKTILFPVPKPFLRSLAKIFGKKNMYEQLYESLTISPNKAINLLNWAPPLEPEDAIITAGRIFAKNQGD